MNYCIYVFNCLNENCFKCTSKESPLPQIYKNNIQNLYRLPCSITDLDVTFRLQPVDTEVVAGQATKLQCQPPDGYPHVTVTWYKDVTPVRIRIGPYAVSIDQDNSLVFDSVQIEDAGVYYCVAHNEFTLPKSRTSNGAKLIVEGKPD